MRKLAFAALVLAACAGSPPKPLPSLQEASPPAAAPAPTEAPAAAREPASPQPTAVATPPPAPEKPAAAPAPAEKKEKDTVGGTRNASARTAFERGVSAARSQDLAGAESAFAKAVDADAAFGWAYYNLGLTRERRGDLSGALDAYRRSLGAVPEFGPSADSLVRLLARTGKGEDAVRELKAHLEKNPHALGARVALSWVMIQQGYDRNAESEAKAVLKEDELNVPAMLQLATIYERGKKKDLALMVLENARKIAPGDAVVLSRIGFARLAIKDREGAYDAFRDAATLRPDYAEAQVNYGAMLVEHERYQDAVETLERAVRYAPNLAVAHLNLGNAYRGLRQWEKALASYKKVQDLDPSLSDVWFDLAVLYLDGELAGVDTVKRLEQSLTYFQKFRDSGGKDDKMEAYEKDARKAIDKEQRRLERDKRDSERKAKEAATKAEEDIARKEAEKKAAEEAAKAPPAEAEPAKASGKVDAKKADGKVDAKKADGKADAKKADDAAAAQPPPKDEGKLGK